MNSGLMNNERTRPSAVILDLLRSTRSRRYSAGALIEACALFGIAENTVRVTLSRLAARGIIESPSRGSYRLSRQTDALNEFVERWRLGEGRVRPWRPGEWLFARHPAPGKGAQWALEALGFRLLDAGLYLRPDNLALDLDELRRLATGLGLAPDTLLISGRPDGDPVPAAWVACWCPQALNGAYRDALTRLQTSSRRLPDLSPDQARLECFTLGGEIIHLLAKDPLLPAELVDTDARRALWQALHRYDVQGKEIWAAASRHELRHMPRPQLAANQ